MSHPIVKVLETQGRRQTWLARQIERSTFHTNRVLHEVSPATAEFRAACARVLNLPEDVLFHGDDSSASRREGDPEPGFDRRAATAVARAHAPGEVLPVG